MADSVYKIITLVGTSTESWEKAAKMAVEKPLRLYGISASLRLRNWICK